MRVIYKGVENRIECFSCHSIIGYYDSELKQTNYIGYDNSGYVRHYITCPVCNKQITIKTDFY